MANDFAPADVPAPVNDISSAADAVSSRLSDGSGFYDAAKTGQLPAALVGGRLDVNAGGMTAVLDSNNSTTTPLSGPGGTYVGTFTDVSNVAEIGISIVADGASGINGCLIQFSHDAVTAYLPHDFYTISPTSTLYLAVRPRARYFRISYTNGFLATTMFKIATYLRPIATGPSAVNTTPSSGSFGIITRNIPSGTQIVQPATPATLTPSAPTVASVGVASAQAVATASTRKGLVLTNRSSAVISLGFGQTAVLNSGITLDPGDVFVMDQFTFTTAAVNAIAGSAASNLAVQEYL